VDGQGEDADGAGHDGDSLPLKRGRCPRVSGTPSALLEEACLVRGACAPRGTDREDALPAKVSRAACAARLASALLDQPGTNPRVRALGAMEPVSAALVPQDLAVLWSIRPHRQGRAPPRQDRPESPVQHLQQTPRGLARA
jgi:hypothetical protein